MYEAKISEINTYIVKNPWKKWVFIEIITSDGSIGTGEATLFTGQFSVKERLKDLGDLVIGSNPFEIEKFVNKWMLRTFNRSKDMVSMALMSGIEVAMWDLMGKHFGAPVYTFFGGKMRDNIKVYANGWYTSAKTPEDWGKLAKDVVNKGYKALKFDPFGSGSGFLNEEELIRSKSIIEAVHEAVGDNIELLIEGHGRFNRSTAIKIAKFLEKFENIGWFEEPVIPEDIEGMAILSRSTSVPIAAGERYITRFDFIRAFELGAIHVAQPDVINTGGLLETKKIASMAEAYNIGIAPHQAEGPINTFATMQLDVTLPNFKIQEMFDEFAYPKWTWEIVDTKPEVENGYMKVSNRPGIGINLKEKVKDYLADEKDKDFNLFSEGWERRGFI